MRVAIIHYWLVTMRGGEKVLESLCELFPDADIYTHVYDKEKISATICKHQVYTTFINKLPNAKKWYTKYLMFMPKALEKLDLSSYDLIISSESGPAKGIIAPSHIPHICYCHTPMRYLWDHYHSYLKESGFITKTAFGLLSKRLRLWDLSTANRVNYFIANSNFVAKRIEHIYRRESVVIYPPVDVEHFKITTEKASFYLFLGQLTGYKRADLVIKAFMRNGKRLIIVGDGDLNFELPENIKIMGRLSDEKRNYYLSKAKALVFPGEEDFGIVPVEAIASGTPVIAYGRGGALETVIDNVSGVLFYKQSVKELNKAIRKFELIEKNFDGNTLHELAMKFNKNRFKAEIKEFVKNVLDKK